MRIVKHYTTTTVFMPSSSTDNHLVVNPISLPILGAISMPTMAPITITTAQIASGAKTTSPSLEDLVNGILELSDAAAAMAVSNQTTDHFDFKAGNGGNGGIGGTVAGYGGGTVFSTMIGGGGGGNVDQSDAANGGNGGRGGDVNVIICVSCNNYACPHAGAAAATPDVVVTDLPVFTVLPATDAIPSDSPTLTTLPIGLPTDTAPTDAAWSTLPIFATDLPMVTVPMVPVPDVPVPTDAPDGSLTLWLPVGSDGSSPTVYLPDGSTDGSSTDLPTLILPAPTDIPLPAQVPTQPAQAPCGGAPCGCTI